MNITSELSNLQPVELDAGQIFSGKPSGTTIMGYAQPSAYTPVIDPDYIFHAASRDLIVWFLNLHEPLYIFGPTGCGKTSCIKQLAARLNYPVFEVTGHGRLEFADLAGHLTVHKGDMEFEYGPLALAMRHGGLFLLNEIDLVSPEVAAGLNSILDGSPLCISENGGELIEPHPLFKFAATANTNGGGDETGLYQGAQRQNLAFADRFILCELGYPDREVELQLLTQRYSALPAKLCETMVNFANEVRRLFMGEVDITSNAGSLEITFSTRSLLRWADLTIRFQPLARQGIQPVTYALDRALAYRASRESRAMLHELAQRMFPQQEIHMENVDAATATENIDENLGGENGIKYITTKIGNTTNKQNVQVHLRKVVGESGNQHTKDWIAEVRHDSLLIRFGRTGAINQSKFYGRDDCHGNDPLKELEIRASRKLRDGYTVIQNLCSF